jgi:iron complex transport system ATP-binding protein
LVVISARSAHYSLGTRRLVHAIDLDARPGEVLAILGPNGAGKTTLLRLLAGEIRPSRGDVLIDGKSIAFYSSVELARRRAVLPQTESLRFGFLVHEVVALGRYPWTGGTSLAETAVVTEAMKAAGVLNLASRVYTQLSAGERARVQLARVMAQVGGPVDRVSRNLLLDEPTANLDLAHQHEVLGAIRRFSATGVTVIMVLHDLNLAQLYADHVLLLQAGGAQAYGRPGDVLNARTIRRVFGVDVDFLSGGTSSLPWIATRPRRLPAGE